jgi:hypothetical protein
MNRRLQISSVRRIRCLGRLQANRALGTFKWRLGDAVRTWRTDTLDVGYISALSALAGSVVGGFTSTLTTWLTQRAQAHAKHLAHEITRRQDLYRDFITSASKTYADALVNSEPQLPDLVALYSMISRMRILSEPQIVLCADKLMGTIIDTYFAPNRSVRELRGLIKAGAGIDPLQEFSEAAREEIRAYLA